MSFFDSYDLSLLQDCDCKDQSLEFSYRDRFLQRWKRHFYLSIPVHPILPSRLVTPSVLPLENELMKMKCSIDEFHQFNEQKEAYYNQLTRLLDPFSFYRKTVKRNVFPEKSMTNAWLKCWEMIHVFKLIPPRGHVNLFCNAELPGAFLFAMNHFIRTKTNTTFEWMANSLYPSDGSILGDEFGLVKRYPDKWLMNQERDGNVTNPKTIQYIEEKCNSQVDLYTSDIGIGLDHDTFAKQEEMEAPLNLGQIVCGLHVLREGGHLICKTFMFFSPFSISLIYLVSQCFHEFYIYKPETSRAANSEVYLVGKGFKKNKEIISTLLDTLSSWNPEKMNSYLVPVPEDFYLTIFLALHRIYNRQMHYIQQNINTARDMFPTPAQFHHVKHHPFFKSEQQRLFQWKNKFDIPYLDKRYAL